MVVMNEAIAACAQKKKTTNKIKTTNIDCGRIMGNFKKDLSCFLIALLRLGYKKSRLCFNDFCSGVDNSSSIPSIHL